VPAKVKICGVRTPAIIETAAKAGADFVGLVFFDKSPRHLTLEAAKALAETARGKVSTVAALVEDGGRQGLGIEVVERSWGPGFAQLGLRYSSASDEDARFGLAISYLRTGINPPGGEWRATLQLGDEPGFVADLYQPLGRQALAFVNPALEVSSTQLNVFENEELAAELKLRSATFELGVGRELMDRGEIRGGFRVGGGDTRFRVGDPGAVPYDSFHRGELFTRASFDTLDNVSFPRTGSVATVEWRGSNESVLGADHLSLGSYLNFRTASVDAGSNSS
jgi:outer membrane translocation and assembly module TamA